MLIAASGTVVGTAVIDANATVDNTKVALYNQLFQIMGDKFLEIVLSADEKNDYNTLSEFEKRQHDDISNKPSTSKQQQKVSAASFTPDPGDLEPDDDEKNVENKDEIKYKKSNYEKGDDIGLHRFTERFEKTKLRDPKSGQYLEPDFGRGSGSGGHGGSHWKLYDGKRRIGTISKDGRFLRE